MDSKWLNRIIQTTALAITMAAICQELEKPKEERKWHGKVGSFPYDFRLPTVERLKASYWNPEDHRIFTHEVFGIGWAINLYALLDKLRIIREVYNSEEDYLMPTESIKEIIKHSVT